MAYYVIQGLGRSERCQKIPPSKLRIFDSTNLSGLLVSLFTPFGEPKSEKIKCFMKDPQDGATCASSDDIQKLRIGIKRYIGYYLNSNSEKLKKYAHVLNDVLNYIKTNVTDKQLKKESAGDVGKKTQRKLKKQEEKSCKEDKIPDPIQILAEYCLNNSLPEPTFQTIDFGWYHKVIARVGKFKFIELGEPRTATKDAAVGLLNQIQELEFEKLDLKIRKLKKQEEKSWNQNETTDAIRNLAEYCLKNSFPKPIFQTNNLGKKGPNKKIKVVIAKAGKFEFVATGRLETATKDDAAIGLLNKIQKLEFDELDFTRTESRLPNDAGTLSKLLFELRRLCGFRLRLSASANFLMVAHIKKC